MCQASIGQLSDIGQGLKFNPQEIDSIEYKFNPRALQRLLQNTPQPLAMATKSILTLSRSMKAPVAVAAALVLLAPASPAFGCHRFSTWRFPFPQPRCPLSGQRVKVSAPSSKAQPALDIPLPDLTPIIWGDVGDERLRAITLLRALNNSPSR